MPGTFDAGEFATTGQDAVLEFGVPAGPNYQINAIQVELSNGNGTPIDVTLRIHVNNAGLPGGAAVDLGTQSVAVGDSTVTYTPVGATTLASGTYWLVMSNPGAGVQWTSSNPAVTPTGVFTYVDNGVITGGTFFTQTHRFSVSIDADTTTAAAGGAACVNADGRENPVCKEPWQTAAIYCRADGSIEVYGITDSIGWLAFRSTPSEIDAVGVQSQNALIERSDNGTIRLYRLSTGEFQVNAPRWDRLRGNLPDGYVFIFGGCS
jgi:hypothetical protein